MSSVHTASIGSGDNPDLQTIHGDLVALVRRLEGSIDSAPDAATIAAITEQMAAVNAQLPNDARRGQRRRGLSS